MRQKERILVLAGWLSVAIAALHVVIVFLGPPAYRYFGAGPRHLAFSFTSLVIGLFYLAGTLLLWPRLKTGARDRMAA